MRLTTMAELAPWLAGLVKQAQHSQWPLRIGVALLIAGLGLWIAKLLSRALDRVMQRMGIDTILREFLRNLSYAIGSVVTLVVAMDALGVPTTSLLAVLGAAGLGIGLALKDSLSNIASGVMLIALRPFHAGDYVQIAGLEGTVESVRVFQTVLRTPDNRTVFLPNSLITTAPIINFTGRGQRRIEVVVGVGYEQDLSSVRTALLAVAAAHAKVLPDPAADVLVTGLNDNAVGLLLRAWVASDDFVFVRSDLYEAVHREFRRAGISIPFPQRELHLTLPPGLSLASRQSAP